MRVDQRTLDAHRAMLADRVRMRAWREAIERVCPGQVVCEIGVGLGPLSLLALRAGASRVYGIERDPEALGIAQAVLARHGYGASRFVPVVGDSRQVDLPERVGVVLSDLLTSAALGANLHRVLEDAWRRFARPDARILPASLRVFAALARPRVFARECEFFDADLYLEHGMDYADVLDVVRSANRTLKLRADELASPWEELHRTEFADRSSHGRAPRALLRVHKPGTVTGFCVAFEATLDGEARLCNLPDREATHWDQGFCPFLQPLACGEGDLVVLEVSVPSDDRPRVDLRGRIQHVPAPRVARFLAQSPLEPTT
jgi:predicted RNA methylase